MFPFHQSFCDLKRRNSLNMIQQITRGIKISVTTKYKGNIVRNNHTQYAFSYTIEIANQSKDIVQLISRFWNIKDSLNNPIIVQGEGVIGEKPILMPGQKHSYTSGCLLNSPIGAMEGHYNLLSFDSQEEFKVSIPLFKLIAEFSMT